MNPMSQMSNMNMNIGGGGGGMNPISGMNAMGQMNGMNHQINGMAAQQQMNPMAKMQGMANGYPPRRMSPYPSPQMHAAQKRAMYPTLGHGGASGGMGPSQNLQSVPLGAGGGGGGGGGAMPYSHHIQTNGVPVPMQQSYGRAGPISGYGRGPAGGPTGGPGMMQQQRQNTPPYPQTAGGTGVGHPGQPQFYGGGYQNVQG